MKILIMGLPGSGKSTIARELSRRLGTNAIHWDADDVRGNINKHLGFSLEDRLQQARSMGWLSDVVSRNGAYAIADFVCPTPETREAFGDVDILVWVNSIKESVYEDTNRLFIPPENADIVIDYFNIGEDDMEETLNRAMYDILSFWSKKKYCY